MFAFLSSGTELRRFAKGVMPRIAIFVLLFIPLLYGALYLWAFWNPTEHMDNLSVALVNEDVGATDTDGNAVSAGQEITDELLDRQDLKWTLTDADAAAAGVADGTYYFSVTIPEGFSAATVSPAGSDAESALIEVSYNDANSFLATTLGRNAMVQLRDTIAESVGEEQSKTLLVGLNDASDGFSEGADGASQLADGAGSAKDGSNTITVGLDTLADGVSQLDSGAAELADGTSQLSEGATTLNSGLASAASGAVTLSSGASQLDAGADTLTASLSTLDTAVNGDNGLASGVSQLASGASSLTGGLQSLQSSVGTSSTDCTDTASAETLACASSSLSTGARALSSGLSSTSSAVGAPVGDPTAPSTSSGLSLSEGVSQLASGLTSAEQKVSSVVTPIQNFCSSYGSIWPVSTLCSQLNSSDIGQLVAQLQTAAQGAQELDYSVNTTAVDANGQPVGLANALQQLESGAATLSTGTTQLDGAVNTGTSSQPSLVSAVSQLAAGATEVSDGAATLNEGVNGSSSTSLSNATKALDSGAQTLASGTDSAVSGAQTLADGLTQLSSGAESLYSGAATVDSGAQTLSSSISDASSGVTQLQDGSSTLTEGLQTLQDGASTLSSSLSDGADQTNQGSDSEVDQKASVLSDPVELDQTWTNEATSWGEGFAPFFIALALFVGGIITWLLLHALPRRALAAGVSGFKAVMSGFLPAATFGVGQVLVMMAVLIWGLGLEPNYLVGTVLFVILTAFSFYALQQMFIITMGSAAGRVVALALLMFQLSSSGGTYPVQTTPAFFQAINPWMPISYVVNGLRQLITGQLDAQLWISVAVLAGVMIVSLAISSWAAGRQRVWTMARLHPEIEI